LNRSQQRHDERLSAAPDADTLACRSGCHWCCNFSVDVRAVEVFAILDFIGQRFDGTRRARLAADVRANAALLAGLDEMQRMTRNVRCPFLEADGRCGIYPVRPQTCRNYHATDAAGCQRSFEHPEEVDIEPEFAPYVYQAGVAHVEGFTGALTAMGYDTAVFELNAALEAALSEPASRARFDARMAPFVSLEGDEVPPEFGDLED
jgi:Fe-S-cluster containining protein